MTAKEILAVGKMNRERNREDYWSWVDHKVDRLLRRITRMVRRGKTRIRVGDSNVRKALVEQGFKETSEWTSGTDKPWEMFFIEW